MGSFYFCSPPNKPIYISATHIEKYISVNLQDELNDERERFMTASFSLQDELCNDGL